MLRFFLDVEDWKELCPTVALNIEIEDNRRDVLLVQLVLKLFVE